MPQTSLFGRNLGYKQIAAKVGVTKQRVEQILRQANVCRRRESLSERNALIVMRLQAGMSAKEVAEEFNISYSTIQRIASDLNVSLLQIRPLKQFRYCPDCKQHLSYLVFSLRSGSCKACKTKRTRAYRQKKKEQGEA